MKKLYLLYDYDVIYEEILLHKSLCHLLGFIYVFFFFNKSNRDFRVFDN